MPLLLDHSVAPKQSSQAHAEREHCTLDLRVTLLTHQQLHLPTREGHYSAEGREVPRSAVLLGVDISLNLGNEAQSGCCTLESLRKACLPAFLPSWRRKRTGLGPSLRCELRCSLCLCVGVWGAGRRTRTGERALAARRVHPPLSRVTGGTWRAWAAASG